MDRSRSLRTTRRAATVDLPPEQAWDVVASGLDGPQWYVDALPFRFRRLVDRLALGPALRVRPPGRARLETGDRAGFWDVVLADHETRRLVLEARVRAPGIVSLQATVVPTTGGATVAPGAVSRVELAVTFAPAGPLGAAYLLADLPAREAQMELTALHLLTVLRRTETARA